MSLEGGVALQGTHTPEQPVLAERPELRLHVFLDVPGRGWIAAASSVPSFTCCSSSEVLVLFSLAVTGSVPNGAARLIPI